MQNVRSYALIIFATLVVFLGAGLHVFEYSMDEARAWIIATTTDFSDWPVIFRYEGHPPLWYFLLRVSSWITPSTVGLQILSVACGLSAIIVFLRKSPFSVFQKALLCLNFYVVYQYTIIARLYSLEMLLLFLLVCTYPTRWENRGRYFTLLTLLCLTSVFGAGFAGIFFLEFFCSYLFSERKKKNSDLLVGSMAFVFVLSAAFLFSAPGDTYANHHLPGTIWFHPLRWQKIFTFLGSAVFLIVTPEEFWGRSLGLDRGAWNAGYLSLTAIFLFSVIGVFRKSTRALWVFSGTALVTIVFVYLIRFSAFNANYYGHFTLGFLLACWIYLSEGNRSKYLSALLTGVLVLQALSGIVAFYVMIKGPFSRGPDVARHLKEKNVTEVIPGIWGYTSSYLIHSDVRYFDNGKPVKFNLSSSDYFKKEEYEHARVPYAFTGLINQEHHDDLVRGIRERFCEGTPNLRVITNSPLPETFLTKGGLIEEARFTGAIHPMDNYHVYRFTRSTEETPFCNN